MKNNILFVLAITLMATAKLQGQVCFHHSVIEEYYYTPSPNTLRYDIASMDLTGGNASKRDLVVTDYNNNKIILMRYNTMDNGVPDFFSPVFLTAGDGPSRILVGRFNSDNFNDILVTNHESDNVTLFLYNPALSAFSTGITTSVGNGPLGITAAVDGNGIINFVAVANYFGSNISILKNINGTLNEVGTPISLNQRPVDVVCEKFDSTNTSLAILTEGFADGSVYVFKKHPIQYSFTATDTLVAGNVTVGYGNMAHLRKGDFNNDGFMDLAFNNGSSSNDLSVMVLINDRTGKFPSYNYVTTQAPINDNARDIAIDDYNGDGIEDIAVAAFGSDRLYIHLGTGTGDIFADAVAIQLEASGTHNMYSHSITSADFDGDGKTDIATGNFYNDDPNPFLRVFMNTSYIQVINGDDELCPGNSTVLHVNGTGPFEWSTGAMGDSISVSPAVTTSYNVIGAPNTQGCATAAYVVVTVNPATVFVTATPAIPVCQGESVTLTASGANTYQWTNSINNGVPFTPVATTTYQVTASNIAGCSATAQITVVVNPLPDTTVTQSLNSLMVTQAAGATYEWLDCNNGNTLGTNATFSPSIPGTYTVKVRITSAQGCTDESGCHTIIGMGGIDEQTTDPISIFPNPNTGSFSVALQTIPEENARITVMDTFGKIVHQTRLVGKYTPIQVNVPAGIYFVKLENGKRVTTQKIIVH